jgi:hypothetical protein
MIQSLSSLDSRSYVRPPFGNGLQAQQWSIDESANNLGSPSRKRGRVQGLSSVPSTEQRASETSTESDFHGLLIRQLLARVKAPQSRTASPSVADFWALLHRLTGTAEAPSDAASEHDHYLYGAPKRSQSDAP